MNPANQAWKKVFHSLLAFALLASSAGYAQTTINWANPALVSPTVASTAGSPNLTVSSGTWAVGDVIRFTGTSATLNPFSTAATRYYVTSVAGSTLQVATTPGGTALNAVNTTSASTTTQGQDWFTTAYWTGGVVPNANNVIASLANPNGNSCFVINGSTTLYGLVDVNSTGGTDVTLVSGGNGTGRYALTFATSDGSVPKMTLNSSANFLIFVGTTGVDSMPLKFAGTQGISFNAAPGGALTGSGTAATSTAPSKQIRLNNADWTGLSGGIQVERGLLQPQAANQLPSQALTIGNNQTSANNLLAGLSLNSQSPSVDALNGNSLGRIYGTGTLTVGAANGSGNFSGVIGWDFTGAATATALTKTGTGTETISGLIKGTGAVTVNNGTLILSGANTFSGVTTINGGKLVGLVGGACSNSAVTINNTAGSVLGVRITDNTQQWVCGNLTSAGTTAGLEFVFAVAPSATVAPLYVATNLTFTGIPGITLNPANLSAGTYPLIQVGGTAPSGVPTVTIANGGRGLSATASWSGNTLSVTVSGTSTEPLTWNASGAGAWDVNNSGNSIWKDALSATTYYQETSAPGDQVQFTDIGLSADTTVTLNSTVQPASVAVNNSTYNYVISGSGAIAGSTALTKAGSKSVTLSSVNTFTGGLTLNAGTVQVGNAAALGTGASQLNGGVLDLNGISLANGNTINNSAFVLTNSSASAGALAANSTVNADFTIGAGSGGITVARLIAGSTRTVTKSGAGTLTFNGAGHNNLMAVVVNAGTLNCGNSGGYSADRGFTMNAGTVKLAGPGAGSSPNANLFNDGQAFVVNGGTFDLNGWNETVAVVTGAGGVILNNAAGTNSTLTLGADNGTGTFAGSFQNGAGTLSVTKTGSGTQTLTGTSSHGGATTVSAGTLQAGAANVFSSNSLATVTGTLDLNGFDNSVSGLNGAGTVDTTTGGSPVFTVGASGGSGNFAGTLQNSSGTLSLVKTGAGTQALNGTCSYGGTTTISNGTLVVGSSLGGSGAVTVYGPGVLNATNSSPSIGGAVTLSGTNATLSLLDGVLGSLALNGGLTLNNSNVLRYDISSAGMDTITVSGSFSQSGKAIIYINSLSAPSAGTYTLISGASGISQANFVLGNTLPGYTLSLSSDATSLSLNVALNAPASAYWHNRTGTAWNGTSGGNYNWDTDQSSGTSTATVPAPASDVYFAANAASSYSTTLGADFSIKSLTFNTANNVAIGGANTLTLGGPITVNSGAGANSAISTASLVLGVDQNLNVADGSSTLTINSPISGSHALNVNASSGAGTLALSGSSTYNGNTTISAGTLALKNPTNTLPDGSAVTINSGATLSIGTNNDTVGAITLAGGTISGSSGVLTGSSYNVQNGTVAANLGGTAAMTMTGSSVLLSSNSTYSGGTTISTGTIQVGASNALGSSSVAIAASTTLDLNGQTIPNQLIFSGAGTLLNSSASAAAVTTDATLNSSPTIDAAGGNITVARLIGSTTRTVTKTGANTLTLNGAGHNNLVKLVIQGGTVVCANNGGFSADRGFELDYGTNKLAGPGSGGSYPNANLINDGQSFYLLDNGPGTSWFDLNGWNETVGTVYGTSGATVLNNAAGTNSTLTVGGDNATSVNNFAGAISDGSGVLSIAKTGSGVQIFNGVCTYSGNTTVNNGQLQVTASGASPNSTYVVNTNGGLTFATDTAFAIGGLSGAGNVNLLNDGSAPIALSVGANNASTTYAGALLDGGAGATLVKVGTGTLTLSGTNAYSGLTTISNGTVILSPNYVSGASFTVKGGATLGVSGNTASTSAQIGTLTGDNNGTILFSSLPVPTNAPMTVGTLSPAASVKISSTAVLAVGTYNLINYTSFSGGGFGALTIGTMPVGVTAHLVNNTAATPKVVQLVVDAVIPHVWTGAVNTNWDVTTTANWKTNGVTTTYHEFSAALFDDTVGSGQTLANLATNVQPTSVTVSNITKNFTFTTANGSGIIGVGAFTKNGAGTLTLVNLTNSFAGGAAINAGTVVLSSATLGTGGITDNASLVFSNGAQVVSNAISGTGTVIKNGAGTLELSGANLFNGGLVIKNGTVQSDNTNALGAGSVTLGDGASASSATLLAPATATSFGSTNPIIVAAGGSGTYTIQYVGNPDYHLAGGIALNNALTLSVTAGGALFVDGAITSGAGNPAITVDGGNSTTKFVYLTADNSTTFTGNCLITNKGTLKVGHTNALSAANLVYLDSTSTFDNGARNVTIAGLNNFGGVGGTVADAGGAGVVLTLGGSGAYSFSGVINNTGSLLKNGSGTQTLSGANTYTGSTVISNGTLVISGSIDSGAVTVAGGTLAGTGLIRGGTTVQAAGTLSPGGGGALGTLTISNSLNLHGTLAVDINQTAGTNDLVTGLTSVTYGGTLAVNNLSGTLTAGNAFKLFNAGSYSGAFASITPAVPATGLAWNTNTLTTDGILRIATGTASNSTNITFTVTGGQIIVSWPSDHTGWYLQAQTNTLNTGLRGNWVTIPNSSSASSYTNTINPADGAVFYRLSSQP